jgi:hypothetical protein
MNAGNIDRSWINRTGKCEGNPGLTSTGCIFGFVAGEDKNYDLFHDATAIILSRSLNLLNHRDFQKSPPTEKAVIFYTNVVVAAST